MAGITLSRVGGLSPVKQRNNKNAPARYGVWCFIWPYFDPFFLGSYHDRGPTPSGRIEQWKKEGLRFFHHRGNVWTRLPVPSFIAEDYERGWRLVTADNLARFLRAQRHQDVIESSTPRVGGKMKNPPTAWVSILSVDHYEVFVERPDSAPPQKTKQARLLRDGRKRYDRSRGGK